MVAVTEESPAPQILNGERLISITAAGKLLPGMRENAHINSATVWRWIRRGAKSTSGEVIRLEAVRLGFRWLTSAEAVGRFVADLTAASNLSGVRRGSPAVIDTSREALRGRGSV
jgi:hypothetical protein